MIGFKFAYIREDCSIANQRNVFNPKHQSRGNLLKHCDDINRHVTEVAAYSGAKDKGESVDALLCLLLCE